MSTIDVNQDHLYTILDEETADEVCRFLAGCRVSFNKHHQKHKDMYKMYNGIVKTTTNSIAIKRVSEAYEVTERQVRRVIKKWKEK